MFNGSLASRAILKYMFLNVFSFILREISCKFRELGARFIASRSGNVGLIFAIAIGPISMATALTIEYSRFERSYSTLVSNADAAILASAEVISRNLHLPDYKINSLLHTTFNNFMDSNLDTAKNGITYSAELSFSRETKKVGVQLNFLQQTAYSSIFGGRNFTSNPYVEAQISTTTENYVFDIVMCIDATGSMQPTLNSVQANAQSFDAQLRTELGIGQNDERFKIRVRPIYFRDWQDTYYYQYYPWYYRDGLIQSPDFYDLDSASDVASFQSFLNSEYAFAGFDYPEASGACMNEGMRSNWYDVENQTDFPEDENLTVFPIVVVWTDNAIQNLSLTKAYMSPTQPSTYASFESQWNDPNIIPQDPKLMILFGPKDYVGWSTVQHWDNFVHGGSITAGNSGAISIIAANIVEALPDLLRLTH